MATHPSILAWEIPWTEGHAGLQSLGPQRVGNTGTEHEHWPALATCLAPPLSLPKMSRQLQMMPVGTESPTVEDYCFKADFGGEVLVSGYSVSPFVSHLSLSIHCGQINSDLFHSFNNQSPSTDCVPHCRQD